MGTNRLKIVSCIAFLIAIFVLAVPGFANNLLTNGSFETPAVNPLSQCGPYSDCFGYHNATAGNDFIGAWMLLPNAPIPSGWAAIMVTGSNYQETDAATGAPLYFHPQDGTQALDLTGEGNQGMANGIKQTVTTVPGKQYGLSFYLGHEYDQAPGYTNGPSALNLYINGQWVGLFSNDQNAFDDINWQFLSYNFTADSASTTIAFQNATDFGNNYAGLDNVSLTNGPEPRSVPEPGSLILLGSGLLSLFSFTRRKRRT